MSPVAYACLLWSSELSPRALSFATPAPKNPEPPKPVPCPPCSGRPGSEADSQWLAQNSNQATLSPTPRRFP